MITDSEIQQLKQPLQVPKDDFFLVSQGLSLWQVVEQVSEYYHVNIMCYDDIKNKEIHAVIQGKNLDQVLNCLTWLLGIEYIYKDDIYFLGSNTQTVIVLPSSGITAEIEQVFKNVQAKQIGDKVVISGSERDVAKVNNAVKEILDRKYNIFHLYVIEIAFDNELELGIDIDKTVQYAFSWEALSQYQYNPIQSLAVNLNASLQADESKSRVSALIDTDVGILSGKNLNFQIGLDQDRPIYTQSDYGQQSQVTSGFSTQKTGLIMNMKGFFDQSGWYIDISIENSRAESDLIKTLTNLTTTTKLSSEIPLQVFARMNISEKKETYEQGIPFFCELPWVGYFFKITNERIYNRQLVFILQLKADQSDNLSIPDHFDNTHLLDLQKEAINKLKSVI